MDFSLREWLLVLGVVVILGVLLDGFRRMYKGRRESLKLSIDKNLKARGAQGEDYFNGELPNGGARTINRQTVDGESAFSEPADNIERAEPADAASPKDQELVPDPLFADEDNEIDASDENDQGSEAEVSVPIIKRKKRNERPTLSDVAEEPLPQAVEQLIVINVFAKDGKQFNGSELMQVILPCGMRYGDRDIFHRTEGNTGEGRVQFSMANAVIPGTFDLGAMEGFHTPAVSFFLSLPGPKNNMKAFDYMLETARCVAKNLDGELKDDQQSDLSTQIVGHLRQIIRDFERRQLSLLR